MMERVRKGYGYGRASGDTLLGYFPENIDSSSQNRIEMCEVADMIALGLKLTDGSGMGDYWDDVDRWTRNMFAEGQLTPERGEWLAARPPSCRFSRRSHLPERRRRHGAQCRRLWVPASAQRVGTGIAHCCTGNGTRAIYYLWDHMLTTRRPVSVNLLLNRASPWADVDSHIPYAGQVDVRIKQPAGWPSAFPNG